MKQISELFGGGALTEEEFGTALSDAGMILIDACDGGYVPASKVSALELELESERRKADEKIAKYRAQSILKYELLKNGAHNPTLAAAAIGIDGLGEDDEEVTSAVMKKVALLKSEEPYMFKGGIADSQDDLSVVSTGAHHGAGSIDTDMLSDSEYYSRIKMKQSN